MLFVSEQTFQPWYYRSIPHHLGRNLLPGALTLDITRVTASMRLSLEAEFGGWELSRVRLYTDGTRKVLLRRKKPPRGRGGEDFTGGSAQAC